jgi:methylisocitrate lyase
VFQAGRIHFKLREDLWQYSAGAAFRKAVQEESPLQVVGAINANHALLAKRAGFKAIYLSGGGVAPVRWVCRISVFPIWMMC